jgi:hypothetical protein
MRKYILIFLSLFFYFNSQVKSAQIVFLEFPYPEKIVLHGKCPNPDLIYKSSHYLGDSLKIVYYKCFLTYNANNEIANEYRLYIRNNLYKAPPFGTPVLVPFYKN